MRLIKMLLSSCLICGLCAAPVFAQASGASMKPDSMRSRSNAMMNAQDSAAKHTAAKNEMSAKKDSAGMSGSGMKAGSATSKGMKGEMSPDTKKGAMMKPEKGHVMKKSATDSAAAKRGASMDSTKGMKKPTG